MDELLALSIEESQALASSHVATISGRDDVVVSKVSSCKNITKPTTGGGIVYQVKAEVREQSGKKAGFVTFIVKIMRADSASTSVESRCASRSHSVEAVFYETHACRLSELGLVCPLALSVQKPTDEAKRFMICLSKLEGSTVRGKLGETELQTALRWLARFHASFWGQEATAAVASGLWPQGCFWDLDARPSDFEGMATEGWVGRLRLAARAIDSRLKEDGFLTVCHGDAKPDNMLFADGGSRVGLLDFQWAGRASAAKDLAFCISHARLAQEEDAAHLGIYHSALAADLAELGSSAPLPGLAKLLDSYALGLCDLARWMVVRCPAVAEEHLKSKCLPVLARIEEGGGLGTEAEYRARTFEAFPV